MKRKWNEEWDSDFEEMAMFEGGPVASAMGALIGASNYQMMVALGLTKIVVINNPGDTGKEKVFSIFKEAMKITGESFALKELLQKFENR